MSTHLPLEISEVSAAQVVYGDEALRVVVLHQVLVQELGAEHTVVQLQTTRRTDFVGSRSDSSQIHSRVKCTVVQLCVRK